MASSRGGDSSPAITMQHSRSKATVESLLLSQLAVKPVAPVATDDVQQQTVLKSYKELWYVFADFDRIFASKERNERADM